MRILDLYIGRVITSTTFLTLMVFISLSGITKFVEQMRSVGKGSYDLSHAALYVLYAVPRDVEMFFPMAALIGGLIGIGMLASNSELVVMQAAGLSRLDIIKSVMKSATVLIIISMIIAEWIAPVGEASARQVKAQAISGGSLIAAKGGTWAKDGDYFVHIDEVQDTGTLNGIQIYRFNEQLQLTSWLSAQSAQYQNKSWLLKDATETHVVNEQVVSTHKTEQSWVSSLTPDKLGVVTVKPESLSIRGLVDYLDYLQKNKQDPSRYELALWRKIAQPITLAVMLLLALSFIFGPLRSVSMGARIMMGVAMGIAFFITNEVFGSLSLVYQLPAMFGALMPSLIFASIAVFFIKKQH